MISPGGGGSGGPQVERLLLLDVLLGEPVILRAGEVRIEGRPDRVALTVHAGGEEFEDERVRELIDDEATQAVGLGVNDAVGIRDAIEAENVFAEGDGFRKGRC